jgi:uroporphyrinogen decarboxylase
MDHGRTIQDLFHSRDSDAPLFSFWTHFPDDDLDPERLAEATISLQRQFGLDFVKTAPNGMYAVEDYGLQIDFSDVPRGGVARVVSTPFETVEDWANLPVVDIFSGALGRELRSLRHIRAALPQVPVVFTIFSPMTIAAKLSRGRIHQQIADGRESKLIHEALATIACTVSDYAAAAIEAGADGVFFAHQDAGRHLLSDNDFRTYVAPYDHKALGGARRGRFNILHLHGENIRFKDVLDYPVHALNWHSWETSPSIAAGMLAARGKYIVGGIDRRSITVNDISAIAQQIFAVFDETCGSDRMIFAPSCTIRAGFRPETLHAIRTLVKEKLPERFSAPHALIAAAR